MRKPCLQCQKEFAGRSDKRYCSTECKNSYNNGKRRQTLSAVEEVDGWLHRNREILATLMNGQRKLMIDRQAIEREGFKWDYFTGMYLNKHGKTYFLVYDFAWMEFANQQVLLVQKSKNP